MGNSEVGNPEGNRIFGYIPDKAIFFWFNWVSKFLVAKKGCWPKYIKALMEFGDVVLVEQQRKSQTIQRGRSKIRLIIGFITNSNHCILRFEKYLSDWHNLQCVGILPACKCLHCAYLYHC